jgi:uncharacterized membrane protein
MKLQILGRNLHDADPRQKTVKPSPVSQIIWLIPAQGFVDNTPNDLQVLRDIVRDLAARVDRLERKLGVTSNEIADPAATPSVTARGASPPEVTAPPAPKPVFTTTPSPSPPPSQAYDGDLESRIGSHWLNRIGIAAVLVGVSYFLKLAFDNNWIGPAGRVVIGLVAGTAIVAWSERFRKHGYTVFSYSLKAVGIGVLYLSLWASFHVYSLIPSGFAFIAMLAVTAATTVLAIRQDAEILAAFALIGGFATPVLLSTGQNRELQLFGYLVLLDVATSVMVAYKPWRRLAVLSFISTLTLSVGWDSEFYDRSQIALTLIFASIFFVIFALAPMIVRPPKDETPLSWLIPLILAFANAVTYFVQIYAMFEEVDKHITAWFALGLAAVYIVLSRQAGERFPDPENIGRLNSLHLAIALALITIAIPIRLDGYWITIGWLVEALVLLRVGARMRSDIVTAFSVGVLVFGIFRLFATVDEFKVTTLMLNARFTTFAVAIVVLAAAASYGVSRGDDVGRQGAALAVIALNGIALVALTLEVSDYFSRARSALPAAPGSPRARTSPEQGLLAIHEGFAYSALWMAYGAMLMVAGFWKRSAFIRWQALVLIAFTILKVFLYDVSQLDRGYRIVSLIVLGILLLAISFAYQRDWLKLSGARQRSENTAPEA